MSSEVGKDARPRLVDIIEAADRVLEVLKDVPLQQFERNWQRKWLVERGIEIISEASRHLPDAMKARHSNIPWPKVAGIGNVLRHDYGRVAAAIIWKLVRVDLVILRAACLSELANEETHERAGRHSDGE